MKKIRIVLLICLCLLVVGCANPFVESDDKTSVSTFSGDTLRVNYIDQTTPNMIQRISEIFERKPLISKEI